MVATFDRLVAVAGALPEEITNLTGIRAEDLIGQPLIEEILPEFLEFLGDRRILAHNLPFDLAFLQATLNRLGMADKVAQFNAGGRRHLDLLPLTRIVFPRLKGYNLEALIEQMGLRAEARHRALADVLAEIQLLDKVLLGALELPGEALRNLEKIASAAAKRTATAEFFFRLAEVRKRYAGRLPETGIRGKLQPESRNILPRRYPRMEGDETPFDREEVLAVFEPGGQLDVHLPAYEFRQEQVDMAAAVCDAYTDESFLMVEAGTGTGKSWAYLVPAVFWSRANPFSDARTVVSTNTKNLQEQIFHKDLPFLHEHLGVDFQAVLLKGRNNYICRARWADYLNQIDFATEAGELDAAMVLAVWLAETATGDIEEASGFQVGRNARLWSQLRSEGFACAGAACAFRDTCFVQNIRAAARAAEIVVVNHSLLLSDVAAENKILSEYVNLVVDEAHNFENAATDYLGVSLSQWSLQNPLRALVGALGQEDQSASRLASIAEAADGALRDALLQRAAEVRELAENLLADNSQFFSLAASVALPNPFNSSGYAQKRRFEDWLAEFPALEEISRRLRDGLATLLRKLKLFAETLREVPRSALTGGTEQVMEELQTELQGQFEELGTVSSALQLLLFETDPGTVRWIEPVGREGLEVRLRAAPLDVGPILHSKLYSKLKTAVFTSATLSVNGAFDYFVQRLGIHLIPPERRSFRILGSPFDFREQVRVLIPRFLPNPKSQEFVAHGIQLLFEALRAARRGTLVLFTSYQMLDQVFSGIRMRLQEEDLAVIAQGRSGPRSSLLRMLREGQAQVLLGTQSFWEGVDLPGEALEMLVITRLPFEVPSEPVVQARMEKIEREGGNSFYEYTVPNAVLKFRQGFGRLIRTRDDRGVVLLMDSRIISTRYGSVFYQALPVDPEVVSSLDELLERIVDWFS